MLLARIFLGVLLAGTTNALYASDVGRVDWHTPHIGVPRVGRTRFDAARGLVIAATDSNVLAALHSTNGSIVWRYVHDTTDDIVWTGVLPHSSTVLSLSGPSASTLRAFSPSTGALISEVRLHNPRDVKLHEPAGFGVDVAGLVMKGEGHLDGEEEAFVLSGGGVVQRVNVQGGLVRWKWASEDQTSSVMYTHIYAAPHGIYIIGLANSFASYTLHITSLSPQDGSVLSTQSIPSNIAPPTADTFPYVLTPRGVAWLEVLKAETEGASPAGTEIRTVEFAPELRLGRLSQPQDSTNWNELRDVGVAKQGWFLAVKEGGSTSVLDHSPKGLKEAHDLSSSSLSSVSYASAIDVHGKPHIAQIARVASDSAAGQKAASIHVSLIAQRDGDEFITAKLQDVVINTEVDGEIVGTTLGFAPDNAPQLLVTTSTGTVYLFALTQSHTEDSFADASEFAYSTPTKPVWTLDEGLSRLSTAAIFPLPESRAVESLKREENEGIGERWTRHVKDAQNLPSFVLNFARRFMTGAYETPSSALEDGGVERDAFGFRKLIIAASEYGKIYALDSSTGSIIWSLRLATSTSGAKIAVQNIFDISNASAEDVRVVLVALETAEDGTKDTLIYDFNALAPSSTSYLKGTKLFTGRPLAAHLFPLSAEESDGKSVLLVDEDRGVHVYPDTNAAHVALDKSKGSLNIPLRYGGAVAGHVLVPATQQVEGQPKWTLASTWTHTPPQAWPAGELITGLIPRPVTPVASLGKVLGNRTTLYKLLNPHTFALTTSAPDACGVRVLDGVKGTLLYHARLPKPAHGDCDVQVAFVENWLVYVYWDPEYAWVGQSKGRRVVSVELYEGAPDERTRSAELSSFDPAAAQVAAYEQAYIFPHGVKAVTTSQTKFGVTSRDLIVATDKNSIQTFPRLLLNPRRPKLGAGSKPTAEMQEEMLIPYDAVMPDDPRRVVSHVYDVAGVKDILSSPSLLESTTIVFAYGLDLFGTRVAPSRTFDVLSPNFNKAQLVLTLAALTAGIVFVKPMVRRKKLRERWYVRG